MSTILNSSIKADVLTIASGVEPFAANFAEPNLNPFKITNAKMSASGNSITADLKAVSGNKYLQKQVVIGLRGLVNFVDKTSRKLKFKDVTFVTNNAGFLALANA